MRRNFAGFAQRFVRSARMSAVNIKWNIVRSVPELAELVLKPAEA